MICLHRDWSSTFRSVENGQNIPILFEAFETGAYLEKMGGGVGGRTPFPPQGFEPLPNAFFLTKFSKKGPKTAFSTCFFKKLHAAQKIWPKQGLFTAMGELGKSI